MWLMPLGALAQEPSDSRWFGGTEAYEFCLSAIDEDPEQAFDRALAWRDQGGGPPAVHCSALALLAIGQYGDAADRLDALAQDINNGLSAPLRAQILIQAANGWMMQGFPGQAIQSLNAALSLDTGSDGISVQIYFDRARAYVLDDDWPTAIDDLTRALELAPGAKDALTLRAMGYRLQGDTARAETDLARVLGDDADYAPALLERGLLHRAAGDDAAARADWTRVLQLDPEADLLAAARAYLYDLDFPDGL